MENKFITAGLGTHISISDELDQQLHVLCEVAEILNIDDVSFASYSEAILNLFTERANAKQTLARLQLAERELRVSLAVTRHEERLLEKWQSAIQDEHQTNNPVVSLEKRRDATVKKAKEYRKALDDLMDHAVEAPEITVTDLLKQKETNRSKEQTLKDKRAKLATFQGLPPNLEIARHELQSAQDEYIKLMQLRERLLGKMADGLN
ncbi:HAUS1 family protein [Pleurotus pulmonarius]